MPPRRRPRGRPRGRREPRRLQRQVATLKQEPRDANTGRPSKRSACIRLPPHESYAKMYRTVRLQNTSTALLSQREEKLRQLMPPPKAKPSAMVVPRLMRTVPIEELEEMTIEDH